jgi:uncharacterized membrane protein (UPF0127 family)
MKYYLNLFLLLISLNCESREIHLTAMHLDASELNQRPALSVTLEHARSPTEIRWGLMQRVFLPPNQGMLFHFSNPQKVSMWSFNCLIDLSVGFLDQQGIFRELRVLNAYPEKMDPRRPVNNPDFRGIV